MVEEVRCGGATVVHRQGGGVVGGHPLAPMTLLAVDVGGRGQTAVDGLVLDLAPFSLLLFVTRSSHQLNNVNKFWQSRDGKSVKSVLAIKERLNR